MKKYFKYTLLNILIYTSFLGWNHKSILESKPQTNSKAYQSQEANLNHKAWEDKSRKLKPKGRGLRKSKMKFKKEDFVSN